jgi:hypothetical protein
MILNDEMERWNGWEECINELNQLWHLYYCERRWETANSWTRDNHNNVIYYRTKTAMTTRIIYMMKIVQFSTLTTSPNPEYWN